MSYSAVKKYFIFLSGLLILLSSAGCREKTDLSKSGENIVCYAAAYNSGIYKSDNGGISWYPLLEDQEDIYFYSKKLFESPYSKRLYVTTTGAGLFSIDMEKGALNRVGDFKDENVSSVVFKEASNRQPAELEIYLGIKEKGVFKSLFGTDNWEPANDGLTYRDVNVIFRNSGALLAGTINGIFRLDEKAEKWIDTSEGIIKKNIISISATPDGGTIFAGSGAYAVQKGFFQDIPSLYKSVDNGRTWENAGSGLPEGLLVYSITVNPLKPERIYLGTSHGVYRSTDGGNKWSGMEDGLPEEFRVMNIMIAHTSENKDLVYAAGANGLFMALDEDNPNWISRSYGIERTYISDILLQTDY